MLFSVFVVVLFLLLGCHQLVTGEVEVEGCKQMLMGGSEREEKVRCAEAVASVCILSECVLSSTGQEWRTHTLNRVLPHPNNPQQA